jgi:predicted alpha/beta superfamily hydrolase
LPPGYNDSSHQQDRYPVLYLNDGFSVFKNWHLKETVYNLIDSHKIAPIIIVGIDNAINNVNVNPDYRTDEYLPYPEESETTVPNPHGFLYPEFLVKEVLPLINQHYRTLTQAENTGVGGSSYGGYIALYSYFQKPNYFGRILLESTPFFISNEKILDDARSFSQWHGKISIGVSSQESPDENTNRRGQNAQQKFIDIIYPLSNVKYQVSITPGGTHNAKAWCQRLPGDLLFLYPYK